jgi:hypothetical protein
VRSIKAGVADELLFAPPGLPDRLSRAFTLPLSPHRAFPTLLSHSTFGHGCMGEAPEASNGLRGLSSKEQKQLLTFLNSL